MWKLVGSFKAAGVDGTEYTILIEQQQAPGSHLTSDVRTSEGAIKRLRTASGEHVQPVTDGKNGKYLIVAFGTVLISTDENRYIKQEQPT